MENEVSIQSLARRLINTYKTRKWSRTKLYLRKIKKRKSPVVKSEVAIIQRTDDEDSKVYYQPETSSKNIYNNDKSVNICTCRSCPCTTKTAKYEIVDEKISKLRNQVKSTSRIIICITPKDNQTDNNEEPVGYCCHSTPITKLHKVRSRSDLNETRKKPNRNIKCQCCFSDTSIKGRPCPYASPPPRSAKVGCQCAPPPKQSPQRPVCPPPCCPCESPSPSPSTSYEYCCCAPPKPPDSPTKYCCCDPPTPPDCCSCEFQPPTPPNNHYDPPTPPAYCCCPPTPPESDSPTSQDYCCCSFDELPQCCECDDNELRTKKGPTKPPPQQFCCDNRIERFCQCQLSPAGSSTQLRNWKCCKIATLESMIIPTYFHEDQRGSALSYGISRSEEIRNVILNDSIAERMEIDIAIHENSDNDRCNKCGKAKSKQQTDKDKNRKENEQNARPCPKTPNEQNREHYPKTQQDKNKCPKPQHEQNRDYSPKTQREQNREECPKPQREQNWDCDPCPKRQREQNIEPRPKQQYEQNRERYPENDQWEFEPYPKTREQYPQEREQYPRRQENREHYPRNELWECRPQPKRQYESNRGHYPRTQQQYAEHYPTQHGQNAGPCGKMQHRQESFRERPNVQETKPYLPCKCNTKRDASSKTTPDACCTNRPVCPAAPCCKCKSKEKAPEQISTSCVIIEPCKNKETHKASSKHKQETSSQQKVDREEGTTTIIVRTSSSPSNKRSTSSSRQRSSSISRERSSSRNRVASSEKVKPHKPCTCGQNQKKQMQSSPNQPSMGPVPSPLDFDGYNMAACFDQLLMGDGDRLAGVNDRTKKEILGLLNKLDSTLKHEAEMHNRNMRGIITQMCKQASDVKQLKVLIKGIANEKKTPTCITIEKKLDKMSKKREKEEEKRMREKDDPKTETTNSKTPSAAAGVCCKCQAGAEKNPRIGCCGRCCADCCGGCCGTCCGGCCVRCCNGCCAPCEKCCPKCWCWCASCCGACWCPKKKQFKCV